MSKIIQAVLLMSFICLFLFINGCGEMGQQSPTKVVLAAYNAGNAAKYTEADKYLVSADKGGKDFWVSKTANGTIKHIEIVNDEAGGEETRLWLRIYLESGKINDVEESLIKKDGQWKIEVKEGYKILVP